MFFMQYHMIKDKPIMVKLLGCLYNNMNSDDTIFIDNSNSQNDNIAIVLFTLFVL